MGKTADGGTIGRNREQKRREEKARKKGHLQKGTDGWKEEMEIGHKAGEMNRRKKFRN